MAAAAGFSSASVRDSAFSEGGGGSGGDGVVGWLVWCGVVVVRCGVWWEGLTGEGKAKERKAVHTTEVTNTTFSWCRTWCEGEG